MHCFWSMCNADGWRNSLLFVKWVSRYNATCFTVCKTANALFYIPLYSFFISEKYQAFSWYCQTSPFPCSLPDLAPISASAPLRTAVAGVLVHVKRRSHPKQNMKQYTIMKQREEKQKNVRTHTHTSFKKRAELAEGKFDFIDWF